MDKQSIASLTMALKHNQILAKGAWIAIGSIVAWMLTGHHYTVNAAERTVQMHYEQTAKSVDEIKKQLAEKSEATDRSRAEFKAYHDKLADKIEQLSRDQREVLMLLLQMERNNEPQD